MLLVAKDIFAAIDQIMSGVADVMKLLNKTAPKMEDQLVDLNRLIEGAKSIFDLHEDPYVMDEMVQLWGDLKHKKSPMFHSVHAFFIHISISSHRAETEVLESGKLTKMSYSEKTYTALYAAIEQMEPCEERDDIEMALIGNEDMLDFGSELETTG